MSRVAVVVQRCDRSITGGSEALAWQYASLLAARHEVTVLTTCARDYVTWRNELPEGRERADAFDILRFPVACERGRYFTSLHARLLDDFKRAGDAPPAHRLPWRDALADDFVRAQGPHSPTLLDYLAAEHGAFDAIVFCTYLYPTSYFGAQVVPRDKQIFVPTLHDEPPAYLPTFGRVVGAAAELAWLTEAERAVAGKLWGLERGDVIGMAVELRDVAEPAESTQPYVLYCGRIDENKGCRDLLDAYASARRRVPGLELVLTGSDHMGVANRDGVRFEGFVTDERKASLMAGAAAFVMPSPYESFSIATLEAMVQRCPVIVNGVSSVLDEHVRRSGAGESYRGVDALAEAIERAATRRPTERAQLGDLGRAYVANHYAEEVVRVALDAVVARVTDARA